MAKSKEIQVDLNSIILILELIVIIKTKSYVLKPENHISNFYFPEVLKRPLPLIKLIIFNSEPKLILMI